MNSNDTRLAIGADLFHMVERKDLENEIKRLDEKHQRYLKTTNEWTDRTNKRINQIKRVLEKTN
jgi:thymidylate synthase